MIPTFIPSSSGYNSSDGVYLRYWIVMEALDKTSYLLDNSHGDRFYEITDLLNRAVISLGQSSFWERSDKFYLIKGRLERAALLAAAGADNIEEIKWIVSTTQRLSDPHRVARVTLLKRAIRRGDLYIKIRSGTLVQKLIEISGRNNPIPGMPRYCIKYPQYVDSSAIGPKLALDVLGANGDTAPQPIKIYGARPRLFSRGQYDIGIPLDRDGDGDLDDIVFGVYIPGDINTNARIDVDVYGNDTISAIIIDTTGDGVPDAIMPTPRNTR